MKRFAYGLALLAVIAPASAQSLKDAAVAFSKGNWKVLRSVDPMTDKTSCTGIYNGDYSIQLTPDTLFVSISGGIESVLLRYDDQPPARMRLATEMEKKIRSMIISGNSFSQLTTAGRLRYQAATMVSGIKTGEIELTDFNAVLANIQQGCPNTGTSAAELKSAPAAAGGTCSVELINKMKQQGLAPEKILAICQ